MIGYVVASVLTIGVLVVVALELWTRLRRELAANREMRLMISRLRGRSTGPFCLDCAPHAILMKEHLAQLSDEINNLKGEST